jgi:hypothetical protein
MALEGVTMPMAVDAATTHPGGTNEKISLKKAFQYASGAKAIVLSSDPHFTRRLSQIIRLARQANVIMCYPLPQYYDEAIDAGMSNSQFMAYGPSLSDYYEKLGDLVGRRLTNSGLPYKLTEAISDYYGLQ